MRAAFQIQVGLFGHVGAGKTTVLNALFAAPFGEVAKKRTTAGINYFRITSPGGRHTAREQILHRIETINLRLRRYPKIEEQYFDVSMLEPLLTTMRRNTQLVVVDIPGLNQAGTSEMYKTHVVKIWDTFDCIICVMDVGQAVNTDEQVQLLKFVKENTDKSWSPVIILCNKVDEPDNSEIKGLIREMEEEVDNIFGCASVDFIPISAQNAFLYRAVSGLSMLEYASLGTEHIQRICKKEHGHSGMEMTENTQQKMVFSIVNDSKKYQARLQKSNFDSLAAALNRSFGTRPLQAQALRRQMSVMHARFQHGYAYKGVPADQLKDCILHIWWDIWHEMKDDAIQNFRSDPDARDKLHHLFELPQQADEYPKKLGESSQKIFEKMKLLVKEKCDVIMGHIQATSHDGNPKWRFCPRDWSNIIESMALNNKVFVYNFGPHLVDLRFALRTFPSRGDPSESTRVLVSETPNDPRHWGHLEWLVCQYLEENDEAKLISIREIQCEGYLERTREQQQEHIEIQCEWYLERTREQRQKHFEIHCERYFARTRAELQEFVACARAGMQEFVPAQLTKLEKQREREQQEKAQMEKEQREREQREREQQEKAQMEKEQREREQQEREQRQMEREQMEREQRIREQRDIERWKRKQRKRENSGWCTIL